MQNCLNKYLFNSIAYSTSLDEISPILFCVRCIARFLFLQFLYTLTLITGSVSAAAMSFVKALPSLVLDSSFPIRSLSTVLISNHHMLLFRYLMAKINARPGSVSLHIFDFKLSSIVSHQSSFKSF